MSDDHSTRVPENRLGRPISIREAAKLLGCSPWTVRHKCIPAGLPYFRFTPTGKLTFYTEEVYRWISKKRKEGR